MIIVNYWLDLDVEDREYSLLLAGVINDTLDLDFDIVLIHDAIDNNDDFEPKHETLYEIHLVRASIANGTIMGEPAFYIDKALEKTHNKETGEWITPIVQL